MKIDKKYILFLCGLAEEVDPEFIPNSSDYWTAPLRSSTRWTVVPTMPEYSYNWGNPVGGTSASGMYTVTTASNGTITYNNSNSVTWTTV